jgi:serine/threonine protein kinase
LIGNTGQTYGIRADMWALGLSLFEIIAGKQPFANMSSFQTMMAIRTWTPTLPSNPKISNDMKELITFLYVDSLKFSLGFFYIIYYLDSNIMLKNGQELILKYLMYHQYEMLVKIHQMKK